ncbi:MAG: 1-phosphofructokinase family hexose kinase [Clostridiaceae bacterium]|nr:1-phosphofructokinase family hexose kinase [Clostridiaceae bacterium]
MVVTVTINPAMDLVMALDRFRLNVTNRVQRKMCCVGGKGTHVSINLSLMGIRSKAAGVVMGVTGDEILKRLSQYDIDLRFIRLDEGNSRTNYVLTDGDGNCTLISEKGEMMDQTVIDQFVSHYSTLVERGDMVVISGDASNQKDTGLQEKLMDIAAEKGARFCLDASGVHLEAGIRKRPFLIKPNLDELSCLCGRELSTEADIISALREVNENGAENIIASCGGDGSYALLDGRLYRILSPEVAVKNTVGCGDALLSGIVAGYEMKLSTVDILKKATAAAAATAMNEATVGFDPEIAARLEAEVTVKELVF